MKKRMVAIGLLLVVVAAAGAAWYWYADRAGGRPDVLGGSGTIEADEVVVAPQTAGRVVEARLSSGATVKRGEVLYRLDDSVAKLQVDQAAAAVRAANAQLSQVIDDDGSGSAKADAARAQVDQAKAALRIAQVQHGYAVVTAPVDGVVLSVATDAGENAVPGQSMAVIGNVRDLRVNVYIPETLIGRVKVGQQGRLTTDSLDGSFACRVASVATEAEFTPSNIETKDQRVKLVYQVRVEVTDPQGRLKPGMPVDVTFE